VRGISLIDAISIVSAVVSHYLRNESREISFGIISPMYSQKKFQSNCNNVVIACDSDFIKIGYNPEYC
jgi:hypothetical protein